MGGVSTLVHSRWGLGETTFLDGSARNTGVISPSIMVGLCRWRTWRWGRSCRSARRSQNPGYNHGRRGPAAREHGAEGCSRRVRMGIFNLPTPPAAATSRQVVGNGFLLQKTPGPCSNHVVDGLPSRLAFHDARCSSGDRPQALHNLSPGPRQRSPFVQPPCHCGASGCGATRSAVKPRCAVQPSSVAGSGFPRRRPGRHHVSNVPFRGTFLPMLEARQPAGARSLLFPLLLTPSAQGSEMRPACQRLAGLGEGSRPVANAPFLKPKRR